MLIGGRKPDLWGRSPAAQLDVELAEERASALGRLGRTLETALQALSDFDATHGNEAMLSAPDRRTRADLVAHAAAALWQLIVQRESCRLYDNRSVMRDYKVPDEVQRRMGARRDAPSSTTV